MKNEKNEVNIHTTYITRLLFSGSKTILNTINIDSLDGPLNFSSRNIGDVNLRGHLKELNRSRASDKNGVPFADFWENGCSCVLVR